MTKNARLSHLSVSNNEHLGTGSTSGKRANCFVAIAIGWRKR